MKRLLFLYIFTSYSEQRHLLSGGLSASNAGGHKFDPRTDKDMLKVYKNTKQPCLGLDLEVDQEWVLRVINVR